MYIFPMMGLSQRFKDAGYKTQKYTLALWGRTVFEEVLLAFEKDFNREKFCFILREDQNSRSFVEDALKRIGLKNYHILELSENTKGQAHTVVCAIKSLPLIDNEMLAIFNIDTVLKEFSVSKLEAGNYFQVFDTEGDHWSFAQIESGKITKTSEKQRISNHCSSGLYIFETGTLFLQSYDALYRSPEGSCKGEEYIAPMFNWLISSGRVVNPLFLSRNEIALCGTPDEYLSLNNFCNKADVLNHARR